MSVGVLPLIAEGWIQRSHVNYCRTNQGVARPHTSVDHPDNGRVFGRAGKVVGQRADVLKGGEFVGSQPGGGDRIYKAYLVKFSNAQRNISVSAYASEYHRSADSDVVIDPRAAQGANSRPCFIKPVFADRGIGVEPQFYVVFMNRVRRFV
ncbi:hypothetical protein A5736_01445 [Mycobacterium sp. SP-6446]|nr:hypothetical protein A5736_01445 [Mycobacterium sp. SP-6446]